MLIKAIEETRDILLVFGGEVTYAIRTTAHGHPVRPQRPAIMTAELELYTLEIPSRPPRTWSQTLNGFAFAVVFNMGCIMTNGFQFLCLLPLRLSPFAVTRRMYDYGVRLSKGSFAVLLSETRSFYYAPTGR